MLLMITTAMSTVIITRPSALLIATMPKARTAITSSMRASLPVRSIGGRSWQWCSRSA